MAPATSASVMAPATSAQVRCGTGAGFARFARFLRASPSGRRRFA